VVSATPVRDFCFMVSKGRSRGPPWGEHRPACPA